MPAVREYSGRVVLELVQFEVTRHEIKAGEIGLADNFGERSSLIVVPDRTVKCLIVSDIEFWFDTQTKPTSEACGSRSTASTR